LEKETYLFMCMKQMAELLWFPVSVLEIANQNRTFHDTEYMRPCTQVILLCKQRKRKMAWIILYCKWGLLMQLSIPRCFLCVLCMKWIEWMHCRGVISCLLCVKSSYVNF
jgi:hypothetical protein